MKTYRIGIIGLGQRIAHVLAAMVEVGWNLEVTGHVDPAPVGGPILDEKGISAGRSYPDPGALLADGPFDLVMIGSPNHLHLEHLKAAFAPAIRSSPKSRSCGLRPRPMSWPG